MDNEFLFDINNNVPSQTTINDRRSLLTIQNIVRNSCRGYVYLEVGSHLGGTLHPYLVDPKCHCAYSIDLRPNSQVLDERGAGYSYEEVSTDRMLSILRQFVPPASMEKLQTFDADLATLSVDQISFSCDMVFIDAEHTNRAVFRDFLNVWQYAKKEGCIVAFHDSNLISDGIANIESMLLHHHISHSSFVLPDTVFVILFGDFIELGASVLANLSLDKESYFSNSKMSLYNKHGSKALINHGNQCIIDNKVDEAINCYKKAVDLDPDSTDTLAQLGNLLFERKRLDEAECYYRMAVGINPAMGSAWNNLAMILEQQEKMAEAINCYNQAISIDSRTTIYANAERCYRKVIDMNKATYDMYNNFALLLEKQGKFIESFKYYNHAIDLDPLRVDIYLNLASSCHRYGRLDLAEACCRRALTVTVNSVEVWSRLGFLVGSQGRMDEAQKYFQKALDLQPEHHETKMYIKALRKV
ncbi:MAG: tetratricopeptide repeat protein [Magnetococcales bacterium]|nr:tetratricopeptide repeat protein [Magnetococcales bacterium]